MSKHHLITSQLTILLSFFHMCETQWSPVGKPYTFTCYYDKESLAALTWRDESRSLFRCIVNNIPNCDASDDNISLYYKANMTSNGSLYTSSITIMNVPLLPYITSWACQFLLANLTSFTNKKYTLSAFAPAQSPKCDRVTFLDEFDIQIHCYTDAVYPPAVCKFYLNTNSSQRVELTEGSISYVNQPSSLTGYNRTECTYKTSSCILGYGSHVFSVVMYPNITSDITNEMESNGQYDDPILIDASFQPTIYSIKNGDKHTATNNVLSLEKGISVIVCEYNRVSIGYKNLSLQCVNVESYSTRNGATDIVILSLNVSTFGERVTCTCKVWADETNCLLGSAIVFLTAEQNPSISDNDFREAAFGLGITVGLLVVVLISALTVFIVWRIKSKKLQDSKLKQNKNKGEYADIRENPHKYEMPVFKPSTSALEETLKTVAELNIQRVETSSHPSLKTNDNAFKKKQVYSNEQVAENIPNEEYHHYDEAVMNV